MHVSARLTNRDCFDIFTVIVPHVVGRCTPWVYLISPPGHCGPQQKLDNSISYQAGTPELLVSCFQSFHGHLSTAMEGYLYRLVPGAHWSALPCGSAGCNGFVKARNVLPSGQVALNFAFLKEHAGLYQFCEFLPAFLTLHHLSK